MLAPVLALMIVAAPFKHPPPQQWWPSGPKAPADQPPASSPPTASTPAAKEQARGNMALAIAGYSLASIGGIVALSGLAFDLTSGSSHNARFDGFDLVGPGAVLVGGGAVAAGVAMAVVAGDGGE